MKTAKTGQANRATARDGRIKSVLDYVSGSVRSFHFALTLTPEPKRLTQRRQDAKKTKQRAIESRAPLLRLCESNALFSS